MNYKESEIKMKIKLKLSILNLSWIIFTTLNMTQALASWMHVVGMKAVVKMLKLWCLLAHPLLVDDLRLHFIN